MVPGTHDALRVGTTALCVMALREAGGPKEAYDKGIEYLIKHGEARRDDAPLIYNIWAHLYAVQALAGEMKVHPRPEVAKAAAWHIDRLGRYETYVGGWNYYDFHVGTEHPAMEPTSFGTAAALVALWEGRQAGFDVPQPMVERALKRLREMRLGTGAYLYSGNLKWYPTASANWLRGSIGRTQACNDALWLWDYGKIGPQEAKAGLDAFVQEHIFIEMGRQRQFPHEAWYQTAPYYYYFGHYYASRLVERLGPEAKRRYGRQITQWILDGQGSDGSWWDYPMWDYDRPYGTAFAVMTLLRCR